MKTKITTNEFNQLSQVSSIVEHDNKEKKKEIKFKLLDALQGGLADKWYNIKKNTQQMLQYACMRSTEQGFFYCSPKHLSNKFKVSVTTVYATLKELIEAKKLFKVNRPSRKHNGKGNAVYIFADHPNFPIICDILGVDWKADDKADWKTERAENLTLPMDSSDIQASTYSLPTTPPKDIKENVKDYNVTVVESEEDEFEKMINDKLDKARAELSQKTYEKPEVKWRKYVPKEINKKFSYYGELLTDLWRKVKLAERKVNIIGLRDFDKMQVAERVLSNLKKHPRCKEMTLDEMCAYVYKGQLNGLFNLMANYNLEGMFIDEQYSYYAYLDNYGNHIPTKTEPIFEDDVDWCPMDNTEEYYYEL